MTRRGAVVTLVLAGCIPTLTGAPCRTDVNCPTRQYCDVPIAGTAGTTGTCQAGPPPATRVLQIVVTTPAGIVPLGATVQATATALLQSGDTQDVTTAVTWQSLDPRVGTVSNQPGSQGLVQAVSTGEVDVQATQGGVTGTVHLVVANAELMSLAVTVNRAEVAPRTDVLASAVGFFTDGSHADLTSLVAWTSSLPAVVSVSDAPGSVGTLAALSPGTARLRASYQKLTGSTDLTVTSATLTDLSVSPLTPYVSVGTRTSLRATGLFSDGTAQPITTGVQWTVLDPELAFFSSASPGAVEGFAAGATVVQAQAGPLDAVVPLTVSAAPLSALEVVPALPDPIGIGGEASFDAWATFADHGVQELGDQSDWSSTAPDVVAVTASAGLASAVDAGVAGIRAAFGGVATTSTQAVVTAGPSALLVWPPTAAFTVGLPGALWAERVLADGTVEDATQAVGWLSSCPAHVEVQTGTPGGAVVVRSAAGCTAEATLGGLSGQAAMAASARTVQRLDVAPARVTLGTGGQVALTATAVFDDGSLGDVTGLAAWSSSRGDVLVAGNGPEAGHALTADAGTAQLIATFGGVVASTDITVTSDLPVIELWPPLLRPHAGTSTPLRVTAVWPQGDALDVTRWTVFDSSDVTVARVSNAAGSRGELAALQPGSATVTAFFAGYAAGATALVDAGTPESVTVSGPDALPAGQTASYRATARFPDGSEQDITSQAAWTSSSTSALRLRGTGSSRGSAATLAAGQAKARASFGGVVGLASVTVSSAALLGLTLERPGTAVPAGVQVQLGALASFSGGLTLDVTSTATWSSSNPAVATVSLGAGAGLLAARQPGTTQISVAFQGVQATASVAVSAASLTGLALRPSTPAAPVGVEVPLTALGAFSDGTQFDLTAQALWSSAAPARVAVSNGGLSRGHAMGLLTGTATVSAAVLRPDAVVISGATTFTVEPGP